MQHCEGHGCTGYTFLRKANRNRRDGRARTEVLPDLWRWRTAGIRRWSRWCSFGVRTALSGS